MSDGGIVTLGAEEEELEEEREAKAAAMLKPGKGTSRRLVAPEEEEKRAEFPPPSPKFQSTDIRFQDNYVPKKTRQRPVAPKEAPALFDFMPATKGKGMDDSDGGKR